MGKLFNLRYPVLFACALIAGVAIGYLFVFYEIDLFWLIAVIPVTAVVFIFCLLFTKTLKAPIIILIAAAFVSLGAVNCFARLEIYEKCEVAENVSYTVYATVCDKGVNSGGEYIILNNIKADGVKISGKAVVYLSSEYGQVCDVGYTVAFTSEFVKYDAFPYGKLNYYAQDNIKYSLKAGSDLTSKYGFSLFGNVRSAVRKTLYDNTDPETASVIFAMLTGDTQGVEESTAAAFRYGGIAHIFAVSGLHIGIVYGLTCFILKKLKLNVYLRAAVSVAVIFLYSGVCGFTLSSVRAAVMCTVSAISRLVHKKYDPLNALAISVILILLIVPLSAFSAGFQLSVCASGSIILLAKNISRTVRKPLKKLPQKFSGKISDAIGVSLSAQLGTMPVMLANFGYLSGAGLLLNIIVVPVLSVLFVLLFICTIISTIFGIVAPFIVPYAALPLEAVISFLISAGFEKALITGFGAGAFIPAYFIGILLLSDKINLKILRRAAALALVAVFLVSYSLLRAFPVDGGKVIVSAYFGGGEVLIKSGSGNVLIVTENLNPSRTQKFLNSYYSADLSAIIILGGEDCVYCYGDFGLDCDAYVYYQYLNIQPYDNVTVNYAEEFSLCGVDFCFADGYSLLACVDGTDVAVCAAEAVPFENCDILISQYQSENCEAGVKASFSQSGFAYNVYDCGDMVFTVNGESVKKTTVI